MLLIAVGECSCHLSLAVARWQSLAVAVCETAGPYLVEASCPGQEEGRWITVLS